MRQRTAMLTLSIMLAACGATERPDASDGVPTSSASPPAADASLAPENNVPLPAGWFGRVVADAVNVRLEPSDGADRVTLPVADALPVPATIGTTDGTDRVYVLDGPVEADGFTWYLVAPTSGDHAVWPQFTGWIADGDGTDAWLVPDEDPCPAGDVVLEDLTLAASTWAIRLHCFGNEALTLRGWFPDLPPDVVPSTDCHAEPAFLVCVGPQDIRTAEMTFYDERQLNRLDFAIDPAADIELPARGQWIEVIGRFNHPASPQCPDNAGIGPGVGVAICRSQFVVHAARPAGTP